MELPELPGALVLAVAPDTPAAKAGFRKFDLIQELGGQTVKSASDAQVVVDSSKVGPILTRMNGLHADDEPSSARARVARASWPHGRRHASPVRVHPLTRGTWHVVCGAWRSQVGSSLTAKG